MERFSRTYPPVVASVGGAVHDVDRVLRDAGLEAFAPRARAVADELVWNVILHAGGSSAWLQVLQPAPDQVLVEVADASGSPPALVHPDPTDIAGRGLIIVDEMADGWGWRPLDIGKVVWARLDAASPRARQWEELGLGAR